MTAAVQRACRDEREELLRLLLDHAILRRTDAQPVIASDGAAARWVLDSLAVSMTPRGGELAGRLILDKLSSFDGRQVATYGLAAIPILQSVILQSEGRYRGLLVRKEREAWGARKLIEGSMNLDEPVIVLDDSIASGQSIEACVATLEAAGLRVEGCVALVRFGWDGGCTRLRERGYHVEAVYDIFEDFMSHMEGEPTLDRNPTKDFPESDWGSRSASEGLHPALLAREVMCEYLSTGRLLRPPARLDRSDYDSCGGAWISVRSREDSSDRRVRSGFWRLPGESSGGPAEDTVRAAWCAARELPPATRG